MDTDTQKQQLVKTQRGTQGECRGTTEAGSRVTQHPPGTRERQEEFLPTAYAGSMARSFLASRTVGKFVASGPRFVFIMTVLGNHDKSEQWD